MLKSPFVYGSFAAPRCALLRTKTQPLPIPTDTKTDTNNFLPYRRVPCRLASSPCDFASAFAWDFSTQVAPFLHLAYRRLSGVFCEGKISRNASVYAGRTQVCPQLEPHLGLVSKNGAPWGANRCRLSHRPCSAGWRLRFVLDTMPGTVRS